MLLEKFYTNPKIAKYCMKLFKKYVDIDDNDMIIEPSAGSGVFIPYIKRISKNYAFYDIKPEHPEIIKHNFLTLKNDFQYPIHVVGNPPFGRKMSSVIKFIKKCDKLTAKSISFILPRSFKKPSIKKSVPLNYHLKYQVELPENSFNKRGIDFNIPCVFQIWIRKDRIRKKHTILYPNKYYRFTKDYNQCDIVFRRVGYNTGAVNRCSNVYNPNSHYFIKLLHKDLHINDIISKLQKIKINKKSNIGSISVSKQYLIKKFNNIIKK